MAVKNRVEEVEVADRKQIKSPYDAHFLGSHVLAQVYMFWCSKTHLFSHAADSSSPVYSRIFCFCLRRSISAPAPPLKAYSALIGQFKHTPSRWTYRGAQHTVTHYWSEIFKKLMSTEHSEPLETAHRDYCYKPLPHYFILWHHLIQQSKKETEKHNISSLNTGLNVIKPKMCALVEGWKYLRHFVKKCQSRRGNVELKPHNMAIWHHVLKLHYWCISPPVYLPDALMHLMKVSICWSHLASSA